MQLKLTVQTLTGTREHENVGQPPRLSMGRRGRLPYTFLSNHSTGRLPAPPEAAGSRVDKAEKWQPAPLAISPEGHIFYNNLNNFRQLEE